MAEAPTKAAAEPQKNIICRTVIATKDVASLFLGSFFMSLPNLGGQLTWLKYGPCNYFMRYDPDYVQMIKTWDTYHRENARKYAVLPDWPILNIINDMKSIWHQYMFMRWENNYALSNMDWLRNDNNQMAKGYLPNRGPASFFYHQDDTLTTNHHQTKTLQAERRLEERHMTAGQIFGRTPRQEMTKHRDNPNDGIRQPQVSGIRPKMLKTEDYGWHANGLLYNLEANPWDGNEMPTFTDKEQEAKWMGRNFVYKSSVFQKKLVGHVAPDEKFLVPGQYTPKAPAHHD